MNKALKALYEISEGMSNKGGFIKEFKLIQQALTPPTEEEVCKALSEYLGVPVFYNQPHRYFYFEVLEINMRNKKEIILCTFTKRSTNHKEETLKMECDLPPHLITLIGRFYEGKWIE